MEVGCRFSPPSCSSGGGRASVRPQPLLFDVCRRTCITGIRRQSSLCVQRQNSLTIHAVARPSRYTRQQRTNAATLSPAETSSDVQAPPAEKGSKPDEEEVPESEGARVPVEKVVLIQGGLHALSLMAFASVVARFPSTLRTSATMDSIIPHV